MDLWLAYFDMLIDLQEAVIGFWRPFFEPTPMRSRTAHSVETVESAHLGGCQIIRARFG